MCVCFFFLKNAIVPGDLGPGKKRGRGGGGVGGREGLALLQVTDALGTDH